MGKRFKYEAPGALRKAALSITAPHKWRSKTRPWIFDTSSGVRFQLAVDEDAVLGQLMSRMPRAAPRTNPSTLDPAFDHIVLAILDKRRGYAFDWHRLASRTPGEWDSWLNSLGRRL